jgi:catechol 2,3-dioxygenase-like lactoylglutathione lyase family enzyme
MSGQRKVVLALSGATFFLWSMVICAVDKAPNLLRIKAATISTPDLSATVALYRDWLDHRVREDGVITRALARSWGATASEGRRYVLLSTDAAPDVFLRIVEGPRDAPPAPLTTFGWSAIEIIVDDPDRLFAELKDSAFRVIGEPAPLGSYPSIRAFQLTGRAAEVLYLTSETGDRSRSSWCLQRRMLVQALIGIHALFRLCRGHCAHEQVLYSITRRAWRLERRCL